MQSISLLLPFEIPIKCPASVCAGKKEIQQKMEKMMSSASLVIVKYYHTKVFTWLPG